MKTERHNKAQIACYASGVLKIGLRLINPTALVLLAYKIIKPVQMVQANLT